MKMALAAVALSVVAVSAQQLAPGEIPFNAAIYKSSHNAYDRHESLASQIDDYNVWQLELDVYDYRGGLKVNHNCDPASIDASSTLEFLLEKMVSESARFRDRFTIIYVDLKGDGHDQCVYAWGSELGQRLTEAFESRLGKERIYTSAMFVDRDQSRWPSHQELVRRGLNWGVVIDWHGTAPAQANPDGVFFAVAQTDPFDSSREAANAVLINVDGGCDAAPVSVSPGSTNERWLYRAYPGPCGQNCDQLDGMYWSIAVANRYNFVATNCIDRDHTFQPPTQSPDPLLVSSRVATTCPQNYAACEWGTAGFPFKDLSAALRRASPMTTVLVNAGTYTVTASGPMLVGQPMELRAIDGNVVMR